MDIYTRAKIVWPATRTMLFLFMIGMSLINGARRFPPLWILALPYFAIFQILNFIYNVTFGSFIFWERPRTFFFTDRLEAHKYGVAPNATLESGLLAEEYCARLGEYHPRHCA